QLPADHGRAGAVALVAVFLQPVRQHQARRVVLRGLLAFLQQAQKHRSIRDRRRRLRHGGTLPRHGLSPDYAVLPGSPPGPPGCRAAMAVASSGWIGMPVGSSPAEKICRRNTSTLQNTRRPPAASMALRNATKLPITALVTVSTRAKSSTKSLLG